MKSFVAVLAYLLIFSTVEELGGESVETNLLVVILWFLIDINDKMKVWKTK